MEQLNEKPLDERLQFHSFITSACSHLYSKGKFQEERFLDIMPTFVKMAKEDPIFFAHLTSWAMNQKSKDLKVLTVFFNSLNDADGLPFFSGSKRNKPNFRKVSAGALQNLDPHLALRVLELMRYKFELNDYLSYGAHYPSFMKTAFRRYILYRESNPNMVVGIKNGALAPKFIKMYKLMHMIPTKETAGILGWKQKGRDIEKYTINFSKLNTDEIVKEITSSKLSPLIVLSSLSDDQVNSDVAKAILQNCSGNQAVILQNMFRRKGFLEIPEIRDLFGSKVLKAESTVDRIDTLSKELTDDEKKEMATVRSNVRKKQMGDIGKIFLHIDCSVSMQQAIEFAKESTSIIAECVNNPEENFGWGLFGINGKQLPLPSGFEKEDFHSALYGVRADAWGTNCLASYKFGRKMGADVEVFFTDQEHNSGDLEKTIRAHDTKPKAVVIVDFKQRYELLKNVFERNNIPVSIMKPEALKESALVAQAVNNAIKGQSAIIDEILETSLVRLPKWYGDSSLIEDYNRRLKEE